ncbi:acylphosphatase [Candidatus Giovannonibacteria bacterium]|nr:acylphosphatase [Candidatus Giovannonibacteria bacterium]
MAEGQGELYERMRVFGRVQRVLFRDSAKRRAEALGLLGYVRNLEDGSLEIVARGEKRKVTELFEWAKRGPIFARVDRYEIDAVGLGERFNDFVIKY